MEWIKKLMNDQQDYDKEFISLVNTELLDVDAKADQVTITFLEKITQELLIPKQFFIALPIFEIPMHYQWTDEDDDAL